MFENRADAGRQLAAALKLPDDGDCVVVALPRGGVPVAAEICRMHRLPIDLALVRKIGAPGQPELALGAVVNGDSHQIVINQDVADLFGLNRSDVERMGDAQLDEIRRRRKIYLGDQPGQAVSGKTVIVVDDGVATGASMRAAIASLRQRGAARVILALPVAPADSLKSLSSLVDETLCLSTPESFISVGYYYADFSQVGEEEVAAVMKELSTIAPRNSRIR
jgi:putative phosphoribosyl transferase